MTFSCGCVDASSPSRTNTRSVRRRMETRRKHVSQPAAVQRKQEITTSTFKSSLIKMLNHVKSTELCVSGRLTVMAGLQDVTLYTC